MKQLWILLVICFGLVFGVVAQDSTSISYGETFLGEFTADISTVSVTFEGTTGDVIYVSAIDSIVPVGIRLLSPSGGQLIFVDGPYLDNVELSTDGQYTIVFERPEWSQDEGEFVTHLGQFVVNTMQQDGENGSLFEDYLEDAGAVRIIEVAMNEGDVITAGLYGADVGMEIWSPEGEGLLFEGIFDDPYVPLFRFPTTGTYRIKIITAEPGGTDISLFIYRHDVIPATTNDPMTGQLEEDIPVVFAFDVVAGKMWDLNAILPENGESALAIYVFDDRPQWESQIYFDDGSGPNGQPRIRPFIPQADGTYYVALTYDNWDSEFATYTYELAINPSTVLSIPNNSPITGEVTEESGVAQYAYTGKAKDRIRILFRKTSTEGELALIVTSQEDQIVNFMGRNTSVSSFDITLPLDGTYEFVIYNASYDTTTSLGYEIIVEPVTE